jgi:hypothetical protein
MRNTKDRNMAVPFALGIILALTAGFSVAAQEITEIRLYPSPFLLTAAGQTPDVLMVKIVSERSKLEFKYQALAKADDLTGMKSVLVVMGVSMKGLGSAGIKLDEEAARVLRLIEGARKAGLPVVGVFAGGAGGRGGRDQLTDALLAQVAPQVDYLVVIRSGDKDGFLVGIAEKNKIPLTYMETIVDMNKVIPGIFK